MLVHTQRTLRRCTVHHRLGQRLRERQGRTRGSGRAGMCVCVSVCMSVCVCVVTFVVVVCVVATYRSARVSYGQLAPFMGCDSVWGGWVGVV